MECFHVARVLYSCRDKSVHTHPSAGTAGEFVERMADGFVINRVSRVNHPPEEIFHCE